LATFSWTVPLTVMLSTRFCGSSIREAGQALQHKCCAGWLFQEYAKHLQHHTRNFRQLAPGQLSCDGRTRLMGARLWAMVCAVL
jgi:hypothetical protein